MKKSFGAVLPWVLTAVCGVCGACNSTSAEECDAIQREAFATVAASNTCTITTTALFTQRIESGITCRGLDHNKKGDRRTFD